MPNVAGLLDQRVDTGIPKASTDMTKGQGCVFATTGASQIEPSVAASLYLFGVLAYSAKAGESTRVVEAGIVDVQCKNGETWAIGDKLGLEASGQFTKVTSGKFFAISQGTTSGGTGELCRAKLLGNTPASF
jgi:hypothetical protein